MFLGKVNCHLQMLTITMWLKGLFSNGSVQDSGRKKKQLIPMCHLCWLTALILISKSSIQENIECFAKSTIGRKKTGDREMSILAITDITCLTIYDMCKKISVKNGN
jgi:molybdenum cofactor biosynthesis enzyme